MSAEEEERRWKQGGEAADPPHRMVKHQEERHKAREGGEDMDAEEDEEGSEAEGDRDRETPQGAPVEVTRVGGACPPQRKTQTSRDSIQKVRNCCCRESMETSHITTIGHTWKRESRTTPSGSVDGAG